MKRFLGLHFFKQIFYKVLIIKYLQKNYLKMCKPLSTL